jgi:O-antigen ligase
MSLATRKTVSRVTSGIQRVVSIALTQLHEGREGMAVIATVGLGVVLGFGLYSPAQDLAITIAGVSVYYITIVIDPLKGLALWMIGQPLLDRYLNVSLGHGIPDLSLTRLCIGLVSVLLLARTAIRYQKLQPINRFDVVALLYMIGMMQSAPRGLRGVASIQNVFDLHWIPPLIYFAVKNLVASRRSLYLVLYAVLVMGLYSAVYAIYESTTGNVLFTPHDFGFYQYSDSGLRILRGIWNGNVGFGRVFNVAIPICFYFYLKSASTSRKILLGICVALMFVGLYLTYKRGAWLGMIVSLFVMQFFYPQFRRLFIVLVILVSVASALNWDRISTSTVYTDRVNSQLSTTEGRSTRWTRALEVWRVRPLVGHGFQQYRSVASAAGYRERATESEFLEIAVSAGLVGLLPYVGLLLLMGYDGLQIYRGRVADSLADPELVGAFWGILSAYAVNIATAIVTQLVIPSMLFALAGAIVYARRPARLGWQE